MTGCQKGSNFDAQKLKSYQNKVSDYAPRLDIGLGLKAFFQMGYLQKIW